ncbi:hypothetical protein EDC01DRAFT_710654 [Geopyxis carbonaria]|nr:hypothetical protein EDC01DRAFT_710654 [Geopyxis carbonaria]
MAESFHLNQRLSYVGELCTVRFIGTIDGTEGEWLGVEWDDARRGKHSGENKGKKYFECKIPNAGSFIRPKAPEPGFTFLEALQSKYATAGESKAPISLSTNKVFEEVGFDKINQKLSCLKDLKIILLDGLQIEREGEVELIAKTCPNIEDLNLSRNRFEKLQSVADICSALPNLKSLRISGNRFSSLEVSSAEPFVNIKDLEIENILPTWDELTHLMTLFPNIAKLRATYNGFSSIPSAPFPSPLKVLDLGNNVIKQLSSVSPLSALPNLTTLILAHNSISSLCIPPPTVFPRLQHLDVSYNAISAFYELDHLPATFPVLGNLRVAHNPMYSGIKSEDAHMFAIGRLPDTMHVLNHSAVTSKERENAEMWYLSRIAQEISEAGEARRAEVLSRHRRWDELCRLHGEPSIAAPAVRDDKTLNARLLEFELHAAHGQQWLLKKIPRSTPASTLKSLTGRWFGIQPLQVRLRCTQQKDEGGEEEDAEEVVLEDVDDTREVGLHFEKRRVRAIVECKET